MFLDFVIILLHCHADFVVIVGEKELEAGKLTFKDMVSGAQELLTLEEVIENVT